MNKAISDGLVFTPPAFDRGLDAWSTEDGTPGSTTWAGADGGSVVTDDLDFAGCLEVVKTAEVTRVRYMGETPILPGRYLKVTVRVKAMSGPLPSVRIAGWPGIGGGEMLAGVATHGPEVPLPAHGEVVTLQAIVGTGTRPGVDMVWTGAAYGHLGLDLTGPDGGVVRIDDIEITDVSALFLRDTVGLVDVRDYGAKGDGLTDDSAAFQAADADAHGRTVVVSSGTYFLGEHVSIRSDIRFAGGTLVMPRDKRLILQRNFDYPSYLDAFGDGEEAFRKAFQALLNTTDHHVLDLGGRRVTLTEPCDLQAAEGTLRRFHDRRVIRNGVFEAAENSGWDPVVVTAVASYGAIDPLRLTHVQNVASIAVGSLVEGSGVGREIYVREVDVAAAEITLSAPLYDAEGMQPFTFTRFRYVLDFTGFDDVTHFTFSEVEFSLQGRASGVVLPPQGHGFQFRDVAFSHPANRALTSPGTACRGIVIESCQFLSDEQEIDACERRSIAMNVNEADAVIRDCRAAAFRHVAVLGGVGCIVQGNRFSAGDDLPAGGRTAGLVLVQPNPMASIAGNHFDNHGIEWTNERDPAPDFDQQHSFGGLTITGNVFVARNAAKTSRFITIRPHGHGHFLDGLSVCGNVFQSLGRRIDRIEGVDAGLAELDPARHRNVTLSDNAFHGVREPAANPLAVTHSEASPERVWVLGPFTGLPFGGRAHAIQSVEARDRIADEFDVAVYDSPWIDPNYGSGNAQFRVVWKVPTTGTIRATVRIDEPAP